MGFTRWIEAFTIWIQIFEEDWIPDCTGRNEAKAEREITKRKIQVLPFPIEKFPGKKR